MCHVRRYFTPFLYDSKNDATTTDEYSKRIIELLKTRTLLFSYMSNTWKNSDGFEEQYFYATVLYVLSILAHAYNIIIDSGCGSLRHRREVVDGLNDTDKMFLSMLMTTLKLTGAEYYDS